MSSENLYRVTPREAKVFIKDCFAAGLVPSIQSSPGMGKSSIFGQVADEYSLQMVDHRAATSAPEDYTGLPSFDDEGFARFSPFKELFPLEGDTPPKGKDGWCLFFDEFNSASKSIQAACYKIILDRMIGQHKLHENVVMGMAGNLSTDRAITNTLSTAMQSRLVHIEMIVDFDQWYEDVALPQNYQSVVIGFLNYKRSLLMAFDPKHDDKTFPCPRTWEFINKLVFANGGVVSDDKAALYAGTVGSSAAAEFLQFSKVYQKMVNYKDILKDPENCPVPKDQQTKWAVISHMLEYLDEDTFEGFSEYADRMDMTFQVLFLRSVPIKMPELRRHPSYAKSATKLAKYLAD